MESTQCQDLANVRHVQPQNDANDEVPEMRSGHRIVATADALYSIGGYNPNYWEYDNSDGTIYPLFQELWKFNLTTRKWTLLETTGEMPVELASHTALLIGSKLFVHGGTGTPFGHASSNELYVCDLTTLNWRHIPTSGELPERLYGHSLTLVDTSTVYMFGGTTGYEYRNSLHKLDLVSRNWSVDAVQHGAPGPDGRYRHEAVCDEKYLYVLGGGRSYISYGFEQVEAYNLCRCRWEQLSCVPSQKDGFPEARRCHAAVMYKKGAYICGGYNGVDVFDDVWRLDLPSLQWTKVTSLVEPVYFHSADVTKDGCMYIYGGVNKIDDQRNSDIYRLWLDVPSLLEQSWQKLSHLVPNMDLIDRDELRALGIPSFLLARL